MKNLIVVLLICSCCSLAGYSQNVAIPDPLFLNALKTAGVDKNSDGIIQVNEAATITSLNVAGLDINSLTGIETFVNLVSLNCESNNLKSINLNNLSKLETFNCFYNELDSLDLRSNIKLKDLDCSTNHLTYLDLSKNTLLTRFICQINLLTSIDLSNNKHLFKVDLSYNKLTSLNLNNNGELDFITCSLNDITDLQVAGAVKLTYLSCFSNKLQKLDLRTNTSLKTLKADTNKDLKFICLASLKQAADNYFLKDLTTEWSVSCSPLAVGSQEIAEKQDFSTEIYPNPVTHGETVYLNNKTSGILYNLSGQAVLSARNTSEISTADLPSGLYMFVPDSGKVMRLEVK